MSSTENSPYIVEDRRMISRVSANRVKITHTIEPGKRTNGILTCCNAPASCPLLACALPCCDYPSYVVNEMNSSRYIYIRENSLEWNNPTMRLDKGSCCGLSCVNLTTKDNISVLYFDDSQFDDVHVTNRRCHMSRTACCGGHGEQVLIGNTFFCGLFRRSGGNSICATPTFCPSSCCPCADKHELWVEDGNTAARIIKEARDNARRRMKI